MFWGFDSNQLPRDYLLSSCLVMVDFCACAKQELSKQTSIMDVTFLLLVISAIFSQAQSQSGTCTACNCQFDNIQALDQLIDLKIATRLATQTGETKALLCLYFITGL